MTKNTWLRCSQCQRLYHKHLRCSGAAKSREPFTCLECQPEQINVGPSPGNNKTSSFFVFSPFCYFQPSKVICFSQSQLMLLCQCQELPQWSLGTRIMFCLQTEWGSSSSQDQNLNQEPPPMATVVCGRHLVILSNNYLIFTILISLIDQFIHNEAIRDPQGLCDLEPEDVDLLR